MDYRLLVKTMHKCKVGCAVRTTLVLNLMVYTVYPTKYQVQICFSEDDFQSIANQDFFIFSLTETTG